MSEPSTKKGNALRALGCFVLLCAALGGAFIFVAWLSRDLVAASVIDNALREHGVSCDAISVESTSLMGEITLAPTSCALQDATLSQVRWDEPLVLERSGLRMGAVRATHLELTRAPRPTDARAEAWGALGGVLHGPEQVGAVLIFASRMSRAPATPSLEVRELDVRVEGAAHPEMTLRDLRVAERSEGPADAHVQAITLASIGAMGIAITPSVNDVTLHAEASTGVLAGELQAGPNLPLLGTISLQRHVEIVGEQLDQPIPHWRLR